MLTIDSEKSELSKIKQEVNIIMTQKSELCTVKMLLSITTTEDDKKDAIGNIATLPNVNVHVDYDESDIDDAFKLSALGEILDDIDTTKIARNTTAYVDYSRVYAAINALKVALIEVGL